MAIKETYLSTYARHQNTRTAGKMPGVGQNAQVNPSENQTNSSTKESFKASVAEQSLMTGASKTTQQLNTINQPSVTPKSTNMVSGGASVEENTPAKSAYTAKSASSEAKNTSSTSGQTQVRPDKDLLESLNNVHKQKPKFRNADKNKDNEFGFWDFVDIVNPLQHIPIVSTVYRSVSGDEITAPARIVGGAAYGGPIGMASGFVSAMVEETTGKDPGEMAMAMLGGDKAPAENADVMYAKAQQLDNIAPAGGQQVQKNRISYNDIQWTSERVTVDPIKAAMKAHDLEPQRLSAEDVNAILAGTDLQASPKVTPETVAQTETEFPLSSTPTPPYRTKTTGAELANSSSTTELPVQNRPSGQTDTASSVAPTTEQQVMLETLEADSHMSHKKHDALTGAAVHGAPSGRIAPSGMSPAEFARHMTEALDKYEALKNIESTSQLDFKPLDLKY